MATATATGLAVDSWSAVVVGALMTPPQQLAGQGYSSEPTPLRRLLSDAQRQQQLAFAPALVRRLPIALQRTDTLSPVAHLEIIALLGWSVGDFFGRVVQLATPLAA